MLLMNKKIVLASIFVVLALGLSSCAVNKVKIENKKTVNIQEWKTKNGVKVLYVHAPELPMVDINVVFDAGSIRDDDKPGVAKLANSLISHGAKQGNKILNVDEIADQFESIGARFGKGFSKDKAEIKLRTLTDSKLLSKAVKTMQAIINAPTFNKKELERVRKNLLINFEGRKQSPGTIANELFYKGLYKQHPYAFPQIGNEKSVKKIRRKDVVRFYKKYYVAKNTLVTIVGDVNIAKAHSLAEQLVGKLSLGNKAKKIPNVKDLTEESLVHNEYPSSQTHIVMGQPGIHRKDKDYFTLYVANHVLGGSGFGSRIMEEIREKRGLAYSSYSYFVPMLKRGPFLIGMQTGNKQTKEAITVLKQTLNDFIENGPTEKELLHSKKNITGGFPLRIDSNKDISNYLSVISFYQLPLSYLDGFNKRIESVTVAKIKDALKRRINLDKMLTVTVGTHIDENTEAEK